MPLVLGSATPSLESWQRAQTRRVSCWSRCPAGCWIGRCRRWARSTCASDVASPAVARGDQPATARGHARSALRDGGQVILLLNRRGFSTHIQCPACGHVVRCPALRHRADAPSHRRRSRCATTATTRCPRRRVCPQCDFAGIRYSGLGTQRLEAEVRARFPDVRLPADGHRHHAAAAAATNGAGGVPLGQGADPAGHADDRQGARFSQRDAGRA